MLARSTHAPPLPQGFFSLCRMMMSNPAAQRYMLSVPHRFSRSCLMPPLTFPPAVGHCIIISLSCFSCRFSCLFYFVFFPHCQRRLSPSPSSPPSCHNTQPHTIFTFLFWEEIKNLVTRWGYWRFIPSWLSWAVLGTSRAELTECWNWPRVQDLFLDVRLKQRFTRFCG